MINGNELRLRITLDGSRQLLLHEVSHSVDVSYSLLEVTRNNTGSHSEFIPQRFSATISFEGQMDWTAEGINTVDLFDKVLEGTPVDISSGNIENSIVNFGGLVTSFNMTGVTDELATVGLTIQASGSVTQQNIANLLELCINGATVCINGETLQVNTVR